MDNKSFKIDFIGIGAPKTGTSWISACLSEHPEICHSSRHEVVFFDNDENYRKGLEYYKKFFAHCKNRGQIKGEISPGYMFSTDAAQRIKKAFPNVKLIICLRNPIERAYSHYLAHARHGKNILWIESFDAIQHNHDNPYFRGGFYYEHLLGYINEFGRENILILIYDDIKKNPLTFIQNIYSFLGVNSDFVPPSLFRRINAAEEHTVYSIAINQWLVYGKLGAVLSRKLIFYKQMRQFLKRTGIFKYSRKIIEQLNQKNKPWKREPMPEETRAFLQKAYQDDIARLEKLLDRKLDTWK